MRSNKSRYLTNEILHTHYDYKKINETSKFPIELLYLDQDFTRKYIGLFYKFKIIFPAELIYIIFEIIYHKELFSPKFEQLGDEHFVHAEAKNPDTYFDGIFRVNTYKVFKNTHCDKCNTFLLCKIYGCQNRIMNSPYCDLHLNCSLCGFNRLFEKCKNHDLDTDETYKNLSNNQDHLMEKTDKSEWKKYTIKMEEDYFDK